MRLFNISVLPDNLTAEVSWHADTVGYSYTVEWKVSYLNSVVQTTSNAVGGYYGAVTLDAADFTAALISGMTLEDQNFWVRIVALDDTYEISQWYPVTLSTVQTTEVNDTTLGSDLYIPTTTRVGDSMAASLPSWMDISRIPGTGVENVGPVEFEGTALLVLNSPPDNISPGNICYSTETPTVKYIVAQAPYIAEATVDNHDIYLVIEESVYGLVTGNLCWPKESPTQKYSITDIQNGLQIFLDRGTTETGVWCFQANAVLLDRILDPLNTSRSNWKFDTIGRRLLESIARPIQQFSDYLEETRNSYSVELLPDLPWFGHIASLPFQKDLDKKFLEITRVGQTLPMLKVDNAYDLLHVPLPCYFPLDTVVLFNNLQMVEEVVSVTDGVFTTAAKVLEDLPFYIKDEIYGWELLNKGLREISGTSVTIVTLYTTPLTDTISIRYSMTTDLENPYTPLVSVDINSKRVLPQPHLLWNAYDELGVFAGIKRFWMEDYYETNDRFEERIKAAQILPADGVWNSLLGWMGIRLDTIHYYLWDTNTDLTITETNPYLFVPEILEIQRVSKQSLLKTESRYYLAEKPLGEVLIFRNDSLIDITVSLDTEGYAYIDVMDADRSPLYSASYDFQVWSFTAGILSAEIDLKGQYLAVFSIEGLDAKTFDDVEYRKTLLDEFGLANEKYKEYATEIVSRSPITIGNAIWGTSFWFSRVEPNPEIARLPTSWQ